MECWEAVVIEDEEATSAISGGEIADRLSARWFDGLPSQSSFVAPWFSTLERSFSKRKRPSYVVFDGENDSTVKNEPGGVLSGRTPTRR